jgi:GNAT superfamily N-acetyltransferase
VIRPATPDDVTSIVAMVHELATFERAADQCALTTDALHAALFAPSPAVWAHVAVDDDTGEVVGFAVWFLNFSTWTGRHGIWLEDLYVRPDARRGGHGLALLAELARTAAERGYPRVDWWVLDWNESAHAFYRRLGAESMDEWTVWRLTGDALRRLGRR